MNRDLRRDLYAVAAAALLVVAAALTGIAIKRAKDVLHVGWPPLYANWGPHVGPGTPAAVTVAIAVVAYGPSLAARLPWRPLLWTSWATAMAWTFSLALIDGWHRGIARRLTTGYEYLQVIDRFQDIPDTLRDFTHHILIGSPDNWPAHVAGHPPGATLTFVLLDRIGLGGGAWAGVFVITAGATAAAAVLVTLRALAGEALARRAAPFLVLAPAAVWAGTSADGYFAAVAAWAVAFLALAVTGHRPRADRPGLRTPLRAHRYLSYGLTLLAVIAGAVLLLGSRRLRLLPYAIAGLAVVPVAFTVVGLQLVGGLPPAGRALLPGRRRLPPVRLLGVGQPRLHSPRGGSGDGGGPAPHRRPPRPVAQRRPTPSAAWRLLLCRGRCSCCSSPTCPG